MHVCGGAGWWVDGWVGALKLGLTTLKQSVELPVSSVTHMGIVPSAVCFVTFCFSPGSLQLSAE